ncbi:hypothetical protein PIB30_002461 [Stylosanthes scabra]|uniref:Uncharacterized protein n=1 Tax=Stylosanthes scabra TaxID=79078 RepID=A0ABU6X2R7_9FABA|nr:hypothetical protein [Stylosanthes scabra]
MQARLIRDRLASSLSVRHSRTRCFVRTSWRVGWLVDLTRVSYWAKSMIGVCVCLLGCVGPMSRTVAPMLWSFGESELRKLIYPEPASIYVGVSTDPTFVRWFAPSSRVVTSELRKIVFFVVLVVYIFILPILLDCSVNSGLTSHGVSRPFHFSDGVKGPILAVNGGEFNGREPRSWAGGRCGRGGPNATRTVDPLSVGGSRRFGGATDIKPSDEAALAVGERSDVHRVWYSGFVTDFQQRLLNRSCIAPSQLHPNAWASIRCFELVTEWLQLPQESEVFLCLFTFYSGNTQGKTKKGYMSVRPTKYRKIFGLFEDSFHDFKGHFFKILPVGTHRSFWLNLEGDGRFLSYWTDKARFDVAPVIYKGLRAHQKDTVDVLTALFAKNNLAPKVLLGRPKDAWRDVVRMAGNDVTLNRLRLLVRPPASTGPIVPPTPAVGHGESGPSSTARTNASSIGPTPDVIITPEQGSSNDGGHGVGATDDQLSPPSSNRRSIPVESSAAKRHRTETPARKFSPLDRSFDASKFIADNLLGPKAPEALRDYDPVKSFR